MQQKFLLKSLHKILFKGTVTDTCCMVDSSMVSTRLKKAGERAWEPGAFLRCSSPKHGIPSKLLKAHSGSARGYSSMKSMLHTVNYLY